MVVLTAADWIKLQDLGRFVEPVEIYDETGTFLGLFVPANLEQGKKLYAEVIAQTDWAELENRNQSKQPGKTTAEVLEYLRSLEDNSSAPVLPTGEEKPGCVSP